MAPKHLHCAQRQRTLAAVLHLDVDHRLEDLDIVVLDLTLGQLVVAQAAEPEVRDPVGGLLGLVLLGVLNTIC